MELFACQLQILLVMGEMVEAKKCEQAITVLVHAWGVDRPPRTIKRQFQKIVKQIQKPLIEYTDPSQQAEQEADLYFVQKGRGPLHGIPRKTRLQNTLLGTQFTVLVVVCHCEGYPLLERSQKIMTTKTRIVSTLMISLLNLNLLRLRLAMKMSKCPPRQSVHYSSMWLVGFHLVLLAFCQIHADTSHSSFQGSFSAKMGDDSCQEDSKRPTNAQVEWQTGQNRSFWESHLFKEVDDVLEDGEAKWKVANDGKKSK
jgi:hypothetical protein